MLGLPSILTVDAGLAFCSRLGAPLGCDLLTELATQAGQPLSQWRRAALVRLRGAPEAVSRSPRCPLTHLAVSAKHPPDISLCISYSPVDCSRPSWMSSGNGVKEFSLSPETSDRLSTISIGRSSHCDTRSPVDSPSSLPSSRDGVKESSLSADPSGRLSPAPKGNISLNQRLTGRLGSPNQVDLRFRVILSDQRVSVSCAEKARGPECPCKPKPQM